MTKTTPPLAASDFPTLRPLPLDGELHARGFVTGLVAMALRDVNDHDVWYQSPSTSIHHPRVPGLCVASPAIGWFSVTHIATGRAIGTMRSVDHIREIGTMLRYGVLAQRCGFSFDGMNGQSMGEALREHYGDPLPFEVEGCETIEDYRMASAGTTFLIDDPPSATMSDIDTLLDLLAPAVSS
jgi:hypothetical protein